jgi:FMNH2-dependent dimethyl sulfone monooxygenase
MVDLPQRWNESWKNISKSVQFIDKVGFDFILPIARWKGYGGKTNPTGNCYETISFAGCLTGLTKKVFLFSTVHVPFIHPLYVARSLSTIDNASNGRVGLNVVCGWSKEEFEMFGKFKYDKSSRYEHGKEWITIFKKLLLNKGPINFNGKFFKIKGGLCNPKTIKNSCPPIMSAAFSPDGRSFALKYCDVLFTTFSNSKKSLEENRKIIKKSPKTKIFTAVNIFCKPTLNEANDFYSYCTEVKADHRAVNNFINNLKMSSPIVSKYLKSMKKTVAAGAGTHSIIGSPKEVIEQIYEIYKSKFSGIAFSFINFNDDLKYFSKYVLPKIRDF